MNLADLPLARIFWSIFALEAIVSGSMLVMALNSIANYKPSDGGMVGAWLVVIPIVALALVAGLFLMARAPWAQLTCIVLLLLPFLSVGIGKPIALARQSVLARRHTHDVQRARRGERIFPEEGQRTLAAAISDRDVAKVKAALPGAGDLNRVFPTRLTYHVPLGDTASFLTFAVDQADDDSDASTEVIRLLLAAGANPNVPAGAPLQSAIHRGTKATQILLSAGADPNADDGHGGLVWWNVLEQGSAGDTDVTRLQLLLEHGADVLKRDRSGIGPIEAAVNGQRWAAVRLLAERIPGAKDVIVGRDRNLGRAGETVHAVLLHEVKALTERGQAVPDELRATLARFDAMAGR